MKLSALYVARNEEDLVNLSVSAVLPYVDEVIFVDNESEDNTLANLPQSEKIKIFSYPKEEMLDMGKLRSFALSKVTCEFLLAVDCDEIYTPEAMKTIRNFVENPGEAISARVRYSNLAWRSGYRQFAFNHAPDRIYKTEAVDCCSDVLPLDMWKVKKEYLDFPNKTKGNIGPLEYDSEDDSSIEHRKQPILDAWYYHLARTRGYNFEHKKNLKYQKNMHPDWSEERCLEEVINSDWVAGDYQMEQTYIPNNIPTLNIPRPKVSVVVTCYNKGEFIGHTLASIFAQTKLPYEVIVVNDGSTDNSAEVINSEGFPVKYIYQPNQGVSSARNKGLEMVTGDYFILIDGDDMLKPNYIERCLEEMKGDVQIVTTDFEGLGEWEGMIHNYPHPFNREHLKTAQTFPSVIALCDRHLISRWGNFRHDLLSEDYAWWLELVFRRNANVVHIPEPLCYYRRTTGSRVDQVELRRDEANLQLMNEFREFGVQPVQYKPS